MTEFVRARRNSAKSALLASSVLTAAGAALSPALAQVDEIVVTTQRRAENLQDVPISIIALGSETLENLEIASFEDYAKFLPSVTFQSTGPNATTVYFRGVVSGGDGNHSASLPSVGVYFDEQPVTTILGFLPVHIYDIERVEAIAGPQGTLYGASAQSGVLRIITKKPNVDGFEAGYDLEVNQVEDGDIGYQFEGYLNQPISDNAAIRLVGYYKRDAGYIDNVLGGRVFPTSGIGKDNAALVEDNFNDIDTYGLRAALRVDLDENWTLSPSVLLQRSEQTGVNFFDPDAGDYAVSRFEPEFNNDKFGQAALTLEGKIGNFDVIYAGAYLRRQIDSSSDYTDYAYYYDTVFGYGSYFYGNGGPGDLIDPTQFYVGDDSFGKYSNEIRISSPQDKRLRFIAGFFQNRQTHNIRQQYFIRNLADVLEVTGEDDTVWLTQQLRVDRDLAIFGELYFDLTDRLTFTGGVRGFKYRNSLQGFFGYGPGFATNFGTTTGELSCFDPNPIVANSPCTNIDKSTKNTGLTHRLNLTYELDDSKLVYATYSTGFRPGGVNRRGTLPPYLEDKLVNYEAGFKSAWAENTFIFNGAFFWQKWKDFQFPILGLNGLTEINNAAQARIYGLEADMTWAPTDRFTLNGAVSWINAELSENFCGFVDENGVPETDCPQAVDNPLTDGDETGNPEAPDGTRLPVVPKFKGTLTARYEHPIGALTGHLQGSLSGQTTAPSNLLVADQAIIGDQGGFVIADLNFGVRGDNWRLVGYVNNVFDEVPNLVSFVACPIGTCGQGRFQGTAQPRTYGIRFGQDF